VASPHVPLPLALQLPRTFRHVPGYLALHDADLRIRRSVERSGLFVLERRCRRRPATNTGMRNRSDMHVQARDGYIHVATVHPAYLMRPWNIVNALKSEGEDLWAAGGHAKVANEAEYEDRWHRETRKRRRLGLFRNIAAEFFDIGNRLGNKDGTDRTRINNPGVSALTPAPAP
jgi:hypothetical protein